jgi:dephospho-CoA kinase
MSRERRRSRKGREVAAVGLAGGIGAGKSTALDLFTDLGAMTLSADRLVHELYARPLVAARVGCHFGSEVLDNLGVVDRMRLAEAVRGRPEELCWLEKLVHPLVAEEIERTIEAAPAGTVLVCEVPLLFEAGYERLFDLVVTVEAGAEARRLRSVHGFGLEQFAELEALQASQQRRVEGSDMVFFNDGGFDELARFVSEAYQRACASVQGGL